MSYVAIGAMLGGWWFRERRRWGKPTGYQDYDGKRKVNMVGKLGGDGIVEVDVGLGQTLLRNLKFIQTRS